METRRTNLQGFVTGVFRTNDIVTEALKNIQPKDIELFLYDATFIRLKNAELGYSLPTNIVSRVKLNNVRVFVNGTNLLTWAKEITWKDPELSSGDFTEYPPLRIINFGVNVEF